MKKITDCFKLGCFVGMLILAQISYAEPVNYKTMLSLYNKIAQNDSYVHLSNMLGKQLTINNLQARNKVLGKKEMFDQKTLANFDKLNTELVQKAIQLQLLDSWKQTYSEEELQLMLKSTEKDKIDLQSPLQINMTKLPDYFEQAMQQIDYINR
ncbi:hypothetical protein [Faucicola boevrei]|uniref:hypothetical protein n=1 Tax=Faucicola boevrei TaxID=346665 RepID=UPI0012E9BB93|nr:hypothetical protein [Moraxella boevrei]